MILIIKTNKESLHDLEFVKPVEKILKQNNFYFKSKHYSELSGEDISSSEKIIITGTSLRDEEFLQNIGDFDFIKNFNKPVFGICSGMQIISLIYGGKREQKKEIGATFLDFEKNFLNVFEEDETQMVVYSLHNNYATLPKDFNVYSGKTIPQAIKHKTKEIYGVLFHPEVRNKKIIENFINK